MGEATAGPANISRGMKQSFAEISAAATGCLDQARLSHQQMSRIVACLALAGASEPTHLAAARAHAHPFRKVVITSDAHAACIGAHGDKDGGIIVAGTGSVGWAVLKGQSFRVGGWGFPLFDEGSGAWLGCEALRRVLWAFDRRVAWSDLLRALFADFADDPNALVRWTKTATPRDFASLMPKIVEHAGRGDPVAGELLGLAAGHINALAAGLVAVGAKRIALVGGCAPFLKAWLAEETRSHLVAPAGDALQGALQLARAAAQASARVA